MTAKRKLDQCILAVDRPDYSSATELLHQTTDYFVWYKIGLQLFLTEGAAVLEPFKLAGKKIFLDLKLYDIPNTVLGATRSLRALEPDMLTVHASGGSRMIAAAVEGLGATGGILAVTVLTSFSSEDSQRLFAGDPASTACNWLQEAQEAGAFGFVCSPLEVTQLKSTWSQGKAVTPGIRFADNASDDQARIMTPAKALTAGADYLVLGRAITAASEIPAACQRLADSLG